MGNVEIQALKGTVVGAFLDVVKRNPDKPAVRVHTDKGYLDLSYSELAVQSKKIAQKLKQAGLKLGEAVILPSQRSTQLCAHLLGILWAGGNYVFVDFSYPLSRQRFICKQVNARFGIGCGDTSQLPDLPLTWLEADLNEENPPSSIPVPEDRDLPAYVVFTSGSTGQPKGVIIPHRGILRLVLNTDFMRFDKDLVFLQHSALSFDASTLEIWGPLLNGGLVVIFREDLNPNPDDLKQCIEECGVNALWLTSSLYNSVITEEPSSLMHIRQLLIGGEALSVSHVRIGLEQLTDTQIYNGYGPTENTTFTCIYPIPRQLPKELTQIPIGYPVRGTLCEVFDERMQPVDDGDVGELIAFGDGLACEYLGRPELTAERFVTLNCRDGVVRRGYRTGDKVRKRGDGAYEYLGRLDKQVKIDGHRIEPGEIEVFLNALAGVSEARVVAKTGLQGQKRLAAYLVAVEELDIDAIRKVLLEELPTFMVPHFLIRVEALPKNKNGKLDESKLPDPFVSNSVPYSPDSVHSGVVECWLGILGRKVDSDVNFLDAGGTSLEALALTRALKKRFNAELSDTFVFEYSSIHSQIGFFSKTNQTDASFLKKTSSKGSVQTVAVIGMACQMPGADDVDEFWDNLQNGVESISFFTEEDLSSELEQALISNPNYVKAKGVIKDCDKFDADFFGISPLEATVMDPQQRLMLQTAWHALEDAGACVDVDRLRIGVFVGANWARYYQQYVLPNNDIKKRFGSFNAGLANEADFLSTRLSYKLNLKGPSVNIFTACSTGLVAIAQACAAIENGDCEVAIAGGVSVSIPVNSGYLYQEGGMLSKDGHCRPFDADGSGTTFNDGVGCIVLKRLDLAKKDKDVIRAIVKGYAINNDGKEKASFTAPSFAGQVSVYEEALDRSGIDPQTVNFIETHGTATPLGDPIEVRALANVYSHHDRKIANKCAIGSVKSNIGHTIHAAGTAGFIKAVKAVETGKIPPTLHYKTANTKLELDKTRFYVNSKLEDWPVSDIPRRAAVSSLGVGGTNAHVVIEEYRKPSDSAESSNDSSRNSRLPLFLSARNEQSLDELINAYTDYLSKYNETLSLLPLSHASLTTRKHFECRAMVFGDSPEGLLKSLRERKRLTLGHANTGKARKKIFMFTGQGSQRTGMGRWLYETDIGFRDIVDQGLRYLSESNAIDLYSIVYPDAEDDQSPSLLTQTKYAQPALYLYEYALAKSLISRGCIPDSLIGHSIGEFAAAAIAGVFTFEDGLNLVSVRGELMQQQPPGKMLAVMAPEEEVNDLVGQSISVAAVNAPDRIVLSGDENSIQGVFEKLSKKGLTCSVLHTSHAFHSMMMEPVVKKFEQALSKVTFNKPLMPIVSTVTGKMLSEKEVMDIAYWSGQLRKPVRFSDAIDYVRSINDSNCLAYIEVGPGVTLTSLVGRNNNKDNLVVPATPGSALNDEQRYELEACFEKLWVSGFEIDWFRNFSVVHPEKVRLPGYRFDKQRHWLGSSEEGVNVSQTTTKINKRKVKKLKEVRMSPSEHRNNIKGKIIELLETVTGYDLSDIDSQQDFSEAGLDSLLLTQAVTDIESEFSLGITFRNLMEDYTSVDLLTEHVAGKIAPKTDGSEVFVEEVPDTACCEDMHLQSIESLGVSNDQTSDFTKKLFQEQLRIMEMQLRVLSGGAVEPGGLTVNNENRDSKIAGISNSSYADLKTDAKQEPDIDKPRHSPGTRISKLKVGGGGLTSVQKEWVDGIFEKYQQKYASSKAYAQKHRKYLADPRTVSGFTPECKEITFPIVTNASKGSKIWDIDGNELIDTANGFGPIFFGHSPSFVTEAVIEQMQKGIETGPQSPLAGEVASLFCELTGNERCGFASTGSEAVLGAMRLARTVSGRSKIIRFDGSYHGIFDEVVSRPGKNYAALPGAPGIPRESLSNVLVLPWGDQESLRFIKEISSELAAVLVEPVQSRLPEFHDEAYLKDLRAITEQHDVALILDEVVTGFRVSPGGIRKRFGIDADISTYGKVVGGGYPIGIIGGKKKYLDALDGGYWQYGDESIPECGVTFFAGTFVRHPVALAAAKAILKKIKEGGQELYDAMESRTSKMSEDAKAFIKQLKADVKFENYSSFFYVSVPAEAHWGYMLFTLMVLDGIHIQQYRPNFITTEHGEKDIDKILQVFKRSLAQMVSIGLLEGDMVAAKRYLDQKMAIPPNAKLGRNRQGEPAYFIEDANKPGNYIEVGKP
jgi:amino acid adenylation domain-containing protein